MAHVQTARKLGKSEVIAGGKEITAANICISKTLRVAIFVVHKSDEKHTMSDENVKKLDELCISEKKEEKA